MEGKSERLCDTIQSRLVNVDSPLQLERLKLNPAFDKWMIWKERNTTHFLTAANKFWFAGSHVSTAWRPVHSSEELMSWCNSGLTVVESSQEGKRLTLSSSLRTRVWIMNGRTNGLVSFSSEMCLITQRTRSSFPNLSLLFMSFIDEDSQEKRNHTKIVLVQVVTWRVVKRSLIFIPIK